MSDPHSSAAPPSLSPADGLRSGLSGTTLFLARLSSLAVAGVALWLFANGIPHRFQQLLEVSNQSQRFLLTILGQNPRAFLSASTVLDFYPYAAVAVEIFLVALLTISASIIWLRKSNDVLALTIFLGLITYGVYVAPATDSLIVAIPRLTPLIHFIQSLGIVFSLLFFYTFPDGRFVPRLTRILFYLLLAWVAIWIIKPSLPFNLADPFSLSIGSFLALMVWWISGVAAQIYRYSQAPDPIRKQQTKFFVFGTMFAFLAYMLYMPTLYLLPRLDNTGIASMIFNLTGVQIFLVFVFVSPLTITFSVLRYRLWDIDLVINRTIIYSLLTGVLGILYLASIIILQAVFHIITNQQQSELVTAISTLLLAIAFQPVRDRIQILIERNLYRRRYNAETTLTQFGELMLAEVDLEKITIQLMRVIEDTMQPQKVSLSLLKSGPQERMLATDSLDEVNPSWVKGLES